MTADPPILQAVDGGVAVWRLNRADARNAISPEMKTALASGVAAFRDDQAQKALVITGEGAVFCAGGDLATMDPSAGPVATRERLAATHAFVRPLVDVEKPVIMAVNGPAVGAGVALALLGDIVIASDQAHFSAGFPKVGALPDMGLLYTLPRATGLPRALDFILTDRRVAAPEALSMGLVSRVVPHAELMGTAVALAKGVSRGPGVSLGLSKRLMRLAMTESFDAFLTLESAGQAVAFGSEDFAEGLRAFRDRRAPSFRGR